MYKAKFIITTSNELEPKPEDIIKEYDITYTDKVDLKSQFEEARKVWEEYYVVAVAGFIIYPLKWEAPIPIETSGGRMND